MIESKPPIPDFRDIKSGGDVTKLVERIKHRFYSAAGTIMLGYDLVFDHSEKERVMRITALELYLHCGPWSDPNTDKDPEQKRSGTWYVRRRGPNANTSRVDITAGCKSENISEDIHCGLLLREIDFIDGSAKAIKGILRGSIHSRRDWLPEEIKTLNKIHGACIVSGMLRLRHRERPFTEALAFKPRLGLRHPEEPWNECLRVVVDC